MENEEKLSQRLTKKKYDIRIESARGKILALYKEVELNESEIYFYAKGLFDGAKIRNKMPQIYIISENHKENRFFF